MNARVPVSLFAVAVVIELIVVAGNTPYRFISKPLVMMTLIGVLVVHTGMRTSSDRWMGIALIFALLGDVALLFDSDGAFILGLSAFLVMHLLYAWLFFRQRAIGIRKRLIQTLPVVAFALWMNAYLWPHTAAMRIAILVYSLAISATAITAIFRWKVAGYWWVVAGAFIFILSDTLIAIQKFVAPVDNGSFWIMSTYIIAQFLIVSGYIKAKVSNDPAFNPEGV